MDGGIPGDEPRLQGCREFGQPDPRHPRIQVVLEVVGHPERSPTEEPVVQGA